MSPKHKPLVWWAGEVKSPPFSDEARLDAGYLLRQLQAGIKLSMPESRPMNTATGPRTHELRIIDKEEDKTWRIMYRIDDDAIVIAHVFAKKTETTSTAVKKLCKQRYKDYENACK
jgi:phage-related protein